MRWSLPLALFCAAFACSAEDKSNPEDKPKVVVTEVPAQETARTPDRAGAPEPPSAQDAGEGQSFHDGLVALCESYEKAPKSDDPAEGQKLLHAWIEKNVTNLKVREVFTLIGEMPPGQRAGMMRAAAAKAGITRCPLAGD